MARTALAEQVRPDYFVKIQEHLFVLEPPPQRRRLVGQGDAVITEGIGPGLVEANTAASVISLAPPLMATIPIDLETQSQGCLKIHDRSRMDVVTVIELLSPANKRPGPNRDSDLAKRAKLLQSQTHLVEIDLLRAFPRLPIDGLPSCDDYARVSRRSDRVQGCGRSNFANRCR